MANKHMNRCSTSLFIREMQIKTIKRPHHFIPIRIATVLKILRATKCWHGCSEIRTLVHTLGGKVQSYNCFRKTV